MEKLNTRLNDMEQKITDLNSNNKQTSKTYLYYRLVTYPDTAF
jgi:hypothetical protein